LSPDTWGPEYDQPYLERLGYTVTREDHRFFDGPSGGGMIQIFKDFRRWLPAVLFHQEASFYSSPGFPRTDPSPIINLVPRMSPQHRILRDQPVPRAPSPHVSVEELPDPVGKSSIALGVSRPDKFNDNEFALGFPSLKLTLQRLEKPPEIARESFAKIDDPRLTWLWYSVENPHLTPCLWIAAVIYLGFRLADVTGNNVRDMHIFTSKYIPNAPFPSAQLWTSRKTKGIIRTADDW
jgi:hypothetical protein